MLYHNQSLGGVTGVNATLNTTCFLTFKRLRRAVNKGMVGAVVWECTKMRECTKMLLRNDWDTKLFQTKLMGYEISFTKCFYFFFKEETHSNMFLYIHLQILHQQQDLSFNLTSPHIPFSNTLYQSSYYTLKISHVFITQHPLSLSDKYQS